MGRLNRYLIVSGIVAISIFPFWFSRRFDTDAQVSKQLPTSVTVGNSAPVFTVAPYEDPVSHTTSQTAVGAKITFRATATDANNENYYLILCSTNSVTAGTSGGPPSCGGTKYCGSGSTVSGVASSCEYTTEQEDPYSNVWYAFACDANTASSTCSSYSQGSGNSGSPFYVNHPPVFTAISNNSPRNPGASVTWSATANDTLDGGTVKLLVCKTQAMSSGACTGGQWCASSLVASNPTCSYSIPNPNASGSNNAYVYIVDATNTPASGTNPQTTNVPFVVNNIAPVVSGVKLNNEGAITLIESSTKSVSVEATVVDDNGCAGGEINNVKTYVYRSGIGYTGCDTSGEGNGNHCYPEHTCTAGTCSSKTVVYTCTVPLQYYAEATDVTNIAYNYSTQNWLATVKATDKGSAIGTAVSATGVNVNSLAAFSVSPTSISYPGRTAGQTGTSLETTTVLTPTGNVPLDQNLSGTQMCTNYPTCTGGTPIDVGQQKYSLTTGTAWTSGTALTTTPVLANINIPKVNNGTVTTKTIWWGIQIATGTVAGTYTGVNTITSVIDTTN